MVKSPGVVRIAAVGDIHLGRAAYGPPIQTLFAQVAEQADVLALCGDLTDRGDPEEGRQLGRALATVGVPIVAVLGNHDYESGKVPELSKILCEAGVQVLDGGDACRDPRSRLRGGEGICRRLRPPGAGAVGRGDASSSSCARRWTRR